MAINRIKVSLIAFRPDGGNVPDSAFVDLFRVHKSDPVTEWVSNQGKWRSARVTNFAFELASYEDLDEPYESFQSEITSSFVRVAEWLDELPAGIIGTARQSGLEVFLLVDLFISQDQMELIFPSVFLFALGKLGLEIHVISND